MTDLEPFKIGEPSKPGQTMSYAPSFVVTKSGAFHARVIVGAGASHWFRAKPTDELQVEEGIPSGDMHTVGDRVYIIG